MGVKDLDFSYDRSLLADPVLQNIDFQLNQGECLTVLGENGAGKSTLLKILAGVLKPHRGKITMRDEDIHLWSFKERAHRIAYLSQNPNDYLFHDTVEEELLYTMRNLGITRKETVDEVLGELGIEQYRRAYPRDLSAGERQRVALASILVGQPRVILLDEPTRGLDACLKHRLGIFLRRFIEQKGMSVVLVTQDVEFAAEIADCLILLSQGRIIAQGSPSEVLQGNLFYSTQVSRLFEGIVERVVNFDQAKKVLKNG